MCDTVDVTYQNNANWNNSQYPNYQNFYCNDCADYVSQCLHAGGIPTTSSWSYPHIHIAGVGLVHSSTICRPMGILRTVSP